jgi:hypothetical protein
MKLKKVKCKLKDCLQNEKGSCELNHVPFLNKLLPSKVLCPYYDNDFEKSCQEVKAAGGVLGILLRNKNKMTEKEVKETKKAKRKPRKDKGQKKTAKKKFTKKNSLKDIM